MSDDTQMVAVQDEQFFNLVRILNPFKPEEAERDEVIFDNRYTLADYLAGINEDYLVCLDGNIVEMDDWNIACIKPNSTLILCPIPRGGGGGKNILRMIAMIAVAIIAPEIAFAIGTSLGLGEVAGYALVVGLTMVGQALVNLLLPVKPAQKETQSISDSPSYGIDGAKNVSREGIPVPLCYGNFRMGGNLLDVYVENIDNTQYVHLLLNAGEGEIAGITDIEINDQPIANYIYIDPPEIRLGTDTQTIIDWFADTVSPHNINLKIQQAAYVNYTTSGVVDQFRVDMYASGLGHYLDNGSKQKANVTFTIEYKKVGDPTWTFLPRVEEEGSQTVAFYSQFTDPNELVVSELNRNVVRRSFKSPILPQGVYDIRITRINEELGLTDDHYVDALYVSDINEIILDDVKYINTALLGIRLKLTDQLNGLPKVTYIHQGKLIKTWDAAGALTVQSSSNPAWIAWDMLTNTRYGGKIAESRLDFETWLDWATFCDDNSLTFNGVFDQQLTLWDALQYVFRAGRAQIVPIGTKYSVVIERADSPVMMFGNSNMVKDSFSINWLPMTDRANEIEVSFFDINDGYKQRTVKVYDPAYLTTGEKQKTASITLYGIVDAQRAYDEGRLHLNMNRYIQQTVSFDAPIDSIACTVGSLVYVQHDMPQWGYAGRLAAGSTIGSLSLDRPVTIEAGKSYIALLLIDAVLQHSGTVTHKTGNMVYLSAMTTNVGDRVVIAGTDYRIDDYYYDVTYGWGVLLEDASSVNVSDAYSLYSTDVIQERNVTTGVGEHTTIALDAALPTAPAQFVNFMFGEVNKVKKPFRIAAIEYSTAYTRKITATEYVEAIYSPDGIVEVPPNYSALPASIGQVTNLAVTETTITDTKNPRTLIALSWDAPVGLYAGAEIFAAPYEIIASQVTYLDQNFVYIGKANAGATMFETEAFPGDKLVYKVVAVDGAGGKSPFYAAPTVYIDILGKQKDPNPPIDLVATGNLFQIDYTWTLGVNADHESVEIWASLSNDINTASLIIETQASSFSQLGLASSVTVYSWIRAKSRSNKYSAFYPATTTGISATTINDPSRITTILAGALDETHLDAALNARIDLLDTPTTGLVDVAAQHAADIASNTALIESIVANTSVFDPIITWNFENSVDSWTPSNATLTADTFFTVLDHTAADGFMASPAISVDGTVNFQVLVRARRVAGTGWDGTLYYSASGHSYNSGYRKTIPKPVNFDAGEWFTLAFDMSALTAGGTDWITKTITGIRLDLGNDIADVFDVDWIAVGKLGPGASASAQVGLDARVTQNEGDISANSASVVSLQSQLDLENYIANASFDKGVNGDIGVPVGWFIDTDYSVQTVASLAAKLKLYNTVAYLATGSKLAFGRTDFDAGSYWSIAKEFEIADSGGSLTVSAYAYLLSCSTVGWTGPSTGSKTWMGEDDAQFIITCFDVNGSEVALTTANKFSKTVSHQDYLTNGARDMSGILLPFSHTLTLPANVTRVRVTLRALDGDNVERDLNAVPAGGNAGLVFDNFDMTYSYGFSEIGNVFSASANSTAIKSLDTRVTANEGDISSQSSAITALENTVNNPSTGVAANSSAIGALDSRVTANEGDISSQASSIVGLQADIDGLSLTVQDDQFENGLSYWTDDNTATGNPLLPHTGSGGETVVVAGAGVEGGNVIQITNPHTFRSINAFPIDTSRTYRVRGRVRQTVDPTTGDGAYTTWSHVAIGIVQYDASYNMLTGGLAGRYPATPYAIATIEADLPNLLVADGWQEFEGLITGEDADTTNHHAFSPGTVYGRLNVIMNWKSGNGTMQIDSLRIEEVTDASVNATAVNLLDVRVTANEGDISAQASSISTLSTTVDGHTSTISAQGSSINGLEAQYTIKIDINGRVSGYGLASADSGESGVQSKFAVLANRFTVSQPAVTFLASHAYTQYEYVKPTVGNGYVYQVSVAGTSGGSEPTWPTTVGATVVSGTATFKCESIGVIKPFEIGLVGGVPTVVMNSAIIGDATITNAMINSLSADKISAGTITGSTIQTATSGKRFVVDIATNEAHFYGDRGDTTVEDLCAIGINPYNGDQVILRVGSGNTTRYGIAVLTNAFPGLEVSTYAGASSSVNVFNYGVNGSGNGGTAIIANSEHRTGIYAVSSGTDEFGVGVQCKTDTVSPAGAPLLITPHSYVARPTHTAFPGSVWMTAWSAKHVNVGTSPGTAGTTWLWAGGAVDGYTILTAQSLSSGATYTPAMGSYIMTTESAAAATIVQTQYYISGYWRNANLGFCVQDQSSYMRIINTDLSNTYYLYIRRI